MPRLEGKTALITGANSGIGLATAKTFLAEGASRVYVTGRRKSELDKAVAALGARAVAVQGDVTNPADLDRLHDRVKTEVGRLDVVFANAGYAAPAPLGGLTEDHIDGLLNTNVKGVIWTVQKALPLMGAGGSIILSASIVASKGFGGWSLYSASKAAVRLVRPHLVVRSERPEHPRQRGQPRRHRNARLDRIRPTQGAGQRLFRLRVLDHAPRSNRSG